MKRHFIIIIAFLLLPLCTTAQDQTKPPAPAAPQDTQTAPAAPKDTQAAPAAPQNTQAVPPGAQAQQTELKCPESMQKITVHEVFFNKRLKREFCIDNYEFPNIEGKLPVVGLTWYQAKKACQKAGKHLCSDFEWSEVCSSPERLTYPYGKEYVEEKCNVKTKAPVEIGKNKDCISYYGIFDMVGNVEEWTSGGGVGASGGYYKDGKKATCSKWRAYSRTRKSKRIGFRCCYTIEDQKHAPKSIYVKDVLLERASRNDSLYQDSVKKAIDKKLQKDTVKTGTPAESKPDTTKAKTPAESGPDTSKTKTP
jgi:hypothetical protein